VHSHSSKSQTTKADFQTTLQAAILASSTNVSSYLS